MYEYCNQFNLTEKLANTISNIINLKEHADYICKVVILKVPPHKGYIYSPIINNNLNNNQWQEIIIPAQEYAFMVVMDHMTYDLFSKLTFNSKEQIESTLDNLSAISVEYDGVFDSEIFMDKFPYITHFFKLIDEWRIRTDRVTIDDDVLLDAYYETINNSQNLGR